jgi:dethiobiotin synthetase
VSAIFVTATGTDIGKTFVTAGLIAQLRRQSRTVAALKPVVTGFEPATAATSDPAILLQALGRPADEAEIVGIAPWRFRASLAPDMAAAREGRALDFGALTAFCRQAIDTCTGVLFIEGIGGIMVPLDERHTVLDLMVTLRLPVLLVAGSYLGTISHTLSAVDVLRRRDLHIAAIVVSETPGSTVPLADTADSIGRLGHPTAVHRLPRLPAGDAAHPVFSALAALL